MLLFWWWMQSICSVDDFFPRNIELRGCCGFVVCDRVGGKVGNNVCVREGAGIYKG